jgi:hypothetical protein
MKVGARRAASSLIAASLPGGQAPRLDAVGSESKSPTFSKLSKPPQLKSSFHRYAEKDRRVRLTRRAPHPGDEAKLSYILSSFRHSLADRLAVMI